MTGAPPTIASRIAAGDAGGAARPHVSPWNPEDEIATVVWSAADLVPEAVAAARAAQPAWAALPGPRRGDVLRVAGDLVEARAEAIARDLAREEGKVLPEAVGEVMRAARILRYYGAQADSAAIGSTFPTEAEDALLYAYREPLGVIAAITPWNFPIAIPAWKIAPALAYGNAVVWKSAELTPVTAHHLLRALEDAGLPDGVVNLLLGSGREIGDPLTSHPGIDAITFTGSNAVGRRVLGNAAPAGRRVQLELGGKNPSVVLADAELDRAAAAVARSAFLAGGQKCTATSRVIVERPVRDEFLERLAAAADALVVGAPLDDGVDLGPLSSMGARRGVERYLELGAEAGERITARAPDDVPAGPYVAPTVFDGLAAESPLVREEIFGPVVATLVADDFDEALALANDTPFGLSASVFTSDLGKAMRFSRDCEAGVVKVNQESTGNEPQVPFGGLKGSSYGPNEQGEAAREFFTHWKTVSIGWS
ncbi:MAG TPA: aldehyde dehydrogenase family protein [Solirubrobacterales bacterium]|nr:aldehyde dehydrogenase family protein [Solirubrobacterales bacterium]